MDVKLGVKWKGRRLRVLQNKVLSRIFEHKRDAVTGGSTTLHNEVLHNLYSSSNIVRTIKPTEDQMGGHVARVG
jgi:hypothetical protein